MVPDSRVEQMRKEGRCVEIASIGSPQEIHQPENCRTCYRSDRENEASEFLNLIRDIKENRN